jgi:sugar-specific transcriptional regulator TrmB
MAKIEEELTKIGLSEKESAVYGACLELGPSGALQIARRTGLKRPTVYVILDQLKKRGLIELQLHGLKQKFAAASPDQFDAMIGEQKKRFDAILPDMLALYKLRGVKSQIKYYAGAEGIKSVYETLLREIRTGDPYYVMSDQDNWTSHFDIKWLESFIEKRARKSLDARIILPDSERNRFVKSMDAAWNEKTRLIPRPLNTDIVIYPNRYIINSLTAPIGSIVIENAEVIATQLELFRFTWDSLPE